METTDYIAVPRSRVPDVLELLSRPTSTAPRNESLATGAPDWDEDSVRELVSYAQPKQARLLGLLANRADEVLTARDLEEHLDLRGRALGGVTNSLQKRCRWYGGRGLPFERGYWSNANSYRMQGKNAEMVRAALAERER